MKLVATKSELSALRSCCSPNKVISGTLLSGLSPEYFHNTFTKETYARLLTLQKSQGVVPRWRDLLDDPILSQDVRKKLKDLSSEPIKTKVEATTTLGILNKYRQLRGMFRLSESISEDLRKPSVNIDKLLEASSAKLVTLRQTKSAEQSIFTIGKGNNSTKLIKGLLEPKKKNFLPTGFRDFDNENGGIFYGSLFTLGGSSGAGKSAMASQLALNWSAMGASVVLVPLEMTEEETAARIMANAADLDVRKILLQKLSEDEKTKYLRAFKKLALKNKKAGGSYHIFKPAQDLTIEEIMASVYTIDPEVIIVDYISLLKGVDGDDQWRALGAVARYCKIYAEVHKKIVVLLCQVSEEGKIRYAQAIKEHSNNCWTFVATKQTRESQLINVDQLKARNGRQFEFSLKAKLETMRISDLDIEEKKEHEEAARKPAAKKTFRKGDRFRGKQKEDKPAVSTKAAKDYLADMADEEEED